MLDGDVNVKTAKILNSVIHCNVLYDSIGRVDAQSMGISILERIPASQ